MIRAVAHTFLATAILLPQSAGAQTVASDPAVIEALDVARIWLDAQHDYEELPSIAVAIVHDQELVWSGAVGMAALDAQRPATSTTLYSVCSISKLFTSVALMQLRDQGKVALADAVSKHLPWYAVTQQYEDSSPVTLEGLLTHSAGLPRESDHAYWSGPEYPFPTKERVIAGLTNQETLYSSRMKYQYSNLGLSLAGYVIEEVSGQPYHEYVRQHVLGPLGMSDTYSEMPHQHIGGQLAAGYSGITREGIRAEEPFFEARGIAPAAGYASTVDDLAKFAMWQFRLRGDREEVLHGYTLAEMQRTHFVDPDNGTQRGLGFSVSRRDDKTWVGHGGSCPGFQTTFSMQNDEKIATIAFLNARESPRKYANGVYDLVVDAVLAAAKGEPVSLATDNGDGVEGDGSVTIPDAPDYEEYVGRYVRGLGDSETAVVRWRGGIAMLRLPTDNPRRSLTELEHVSGDTFRQVVDDEDSGAPEVKVIFDRDAQGRIIRVRNPTNYSTRVY
jgi:CubicO group peptidase (beta-lactamase class C family)